MSKLTRTARTACVAVIGLAMPLAIPLAANAAAPVAAPPPPPAPPPKHKPYQTGAQNDVTGAYEYRTRILGSPSCQRFAAESDAAFLDDKINDKVKVDLLKKIGAAAAAGGCLAP